MKRALFIDRDGTLIWEPQDTEQVDTLEQLVFLPGAIGAMHSIAGLDYELVLASNQDGLGTPAYPQEHFDTVQHKFLELLDGEGVRFNDILIDIHTPQEHSPLRKPATGMFTRYLAGDYDMAACFVIGDRLTDLELAHNLGARGILLARDEGGKAWVAASPFAADCALVTQSWSEIAEFLRREDRTAVVERNTRETQITVKVDLDGAALSSIHTGLHFFDHMLDQIVHHAGISLFIEAHGDLEVDEHHTIEDVAITLGEALYKALGSKRGIERYGFALPMDDCRAMVLIDLGGRIDFEWEVPFTAERVGDVPTEMFKHFFKSLAQAMHCNLHIVAKGENNHHLAESVFKAFARSLRQAVSRNVFSNEIPTSKGMLW